MSISNFMEKTEGSDRTPHNTVKNADFLVSVTPFKFLINS
jgi:hypothetical protein